MKSWSIQTKILLWLTVLLVFACIGLTLGASFLNAHQTRSRNRERLLIGLESVQREFSRSVVNDARLLSDALTNNRATTLAFQGMTLIDDANINLPAILTEIGIRLNAARLAFYYPVNDDPTPRLRLYYDRELDGTVQIRGKNGAHRSRLVTKDPQGQITTVDFVERVDAFPSTWPTLEQVNFLRAQPEGLRLVTVFPYISAFADDAYRLTIGAEIGRFLMEKSLEVNLTEMAHDLGVHLAVYDWQGRMGQGTVHMPDLALTTTLSAQVQTLTDLDGQTYDAMLRPLTYHGITVGYLAATISQAYTVQQIGETVRVLVLIAGGVLLIAFLLMSVVVMRLIVQPLKHITTVTHRQLQGELAARVELHTADEYGELGQVFNRLSQQVNTLLQEQRLTIANLMQAEEDIRTLNAKLEQRVRERTTALETVNQELQSFAYVVSHDLKAPLRAIHRLVQWLVEDYGTAFDAKGQEMADLLVRRVKRMDALIEGVLEYSRVGRVASEHTPIDLNRLLPEVIDSLSPPPTIRIDIGQGLPTLLGDKTRIQQVFQNLIGNAIKFMDKPQGQVSINGVADGASWKFTVSDNGPGIDLKHAERLFQIFQTLRPRDEVENTGVGLAIVKKIVEFYGGKVWVESTLGQGSVFLFTLPKT